MVDFDSVCVSVVLEGWFRAHGLCLMVYDVLLYGLADILVNDILFTFHNFFFLEVHDFRNISASTI